MTNAVIFDMDGVIFDTERIWIECWSPVGQAHGIRDIEKVLREQCVGITAASMKANLLETYGADFPYDQYVKEAIAVFKARYGLTPPMKPGVETLLRFLRESGAPLALASSTGTKTIRAELAASGLLAFFDVITGGEEVGRSKPAPDIFLLAARRLGVEPARCFVIEDSYNGIRAARAAGMRPIMVPDLLAPDGEMRETAEAILPSLDAARDYLRGQGLEPTKT
ncbi:MAG: HAD family phosphatase [Clostridia bacterium]|nr:HAD family phosphatase [Clostridia bacterium]